MKFLSRQSGVKAGGQSFSLLEITEVDRRLKPVLDLNIAKKKDSFRQ